MMDSVDRVTQHPVESLLNVNTYLRSPHVVRRTATVAGTVTMFTSRQIQFPQLRHDLWFCRQTMSGLRWPCPAPVDSETTEDAAPSFRSTTGLQRVVIQTLNTSAAPPTATAVVPGNIAPATLASTTGRPEEDPVVGQCPSAGESGLTGDVDQSFHWMMENQVNVMALVGITAAPTGATVDLELTTASVRAAWTTGPPLTR